MLDEAYGELPVRDEGEKDRLVKAELERLTPAYRSLTGSARPPINHREPVTRFAYF